MVAATKPREAGQRCLRFIRAVRVRLIVRLGRCHLRFIIGLTCLFCLVANVNSAAQESVPPQNSADTQSWNWHIQNTETVQGYPGFAAKYSGPQSLPSGGETRETVSLNVTAGVRLWGGAEAYVDGLMWQGFGLGNTQGVEAFPNGEAYRIGTAPPNGTIARLFIRQTIGLGGDQEDVLDESLTLAGEHDISRLTLTFGRIAVTDIFDRNAYANDPRRQFMNWALVNNEAWDYPADSVGSTMGLAVELNEPKWALRYGCFLLPRYQNSLTAEDQIFKWPYDSSAQDGPFLNTWGMVSELERRYSLLTHMGTVRFLAYLNKANMGSYQESVDDPARPADIGATRKYRFKYGFGLNLEQEIVKNIGLFSRLGWNDGQNEAWMFSDVDYALSVGVSIEGEAWHRPDDSIGLAGVFSGIDSAGQQFFEAGGSGLLAGDGNLNYGWEKIFETYYEYPVWKTVFATVDYQFISNPAFNRDRGPVSVFGARLHWEL